MQSYLKDASSWLVAAHEYSGTEIAERELLTGEEAAGLLEDLQKTSLILANSCSTAEVEVINLYADKKGRLDTSPLEQLYDGEKIDVTSKYAVVNVVASSEDQDLSFSGYDLFYQNEAVTYESITRSGYVLYNFTAMEDGAFTDYQGTVTLSDGNGLQGTYLAPAGTVKIQSDLYGAVYADRVESQPDRKLTRIVLIEGRDLDQEAVGESDPAAEGETQSEEQNGSEPADESGTEPGALNESESAWESGTEEKTQSESETAEEPVTETEVQTESTASAENVTEAVPEEATEGPSEPESVGRAEISIADQTELSENLPVNAPEAETAESQTGSLEDYGVLPASDILEVKEDAGTIWYSENGISMKVQMVNGSEHTALGSGTVVVRAAKDILKDNTVVFGKDEQVSSGTWTGEDTSAHEIGDKITCEGSYYIEASQVPGGYLAGPRLYFTVDSTGTVAFAAETAGWDAGQNLLRYQLYEENHENPVTGTWITLTDGTNALSGAEFVVKDSDRKIILNQTSFPKYYVSVIDGKAALEGLAAGVYYLSQIKAPEGYLVSEDIEFTVTEGETGVVAVVNEAVPANSNAISVIVETLFNDTQLTAEQDSVSYMALFLDDQLTKKATDVRVLTQKKDTDASEAVTFQGLAGGKKYYLAETDEFGIPLGNLEGSDTTIPYFVNFLDNSGSESKAVKLVEFDKKGTDEGKTEIRILTMQRKYRNYPERLFSYRAKMKLSLKMYDAKKKAKAVTDTFYVTLYRDEEHTVKLAKPVEISLKNKSSLSLSISFKMTVGSEVYYALETDADGNVLENGNDNYGFAVGFQDTVTQKTDGSVTVSCGQTAGLVVTNTLSKSVVKIKVTDKDGKLLPGAELVLKNASGKVLSVNKVVKFNSESKEITWNGVLPDGKYYLSEVKAPDGYLPAPDVEFTVESGKTAQAVMVNAKAASGGSITVGLQVYVGQDLLYAQDTTTGKYASEGRYTRYAALFSDAARTQKVTDVKQFTISGFTGTVRFESLRTGETYYAAETDQYGQVLDKSKYGGTISYTSDGKVTTGTGEGQAIIRETYGSLPTGFRYTAKLTLEKKVLDSSGNPKAVTDSFYIGIFRSEDYSDTPTVIRIDLQNASSAAVTKRVLLSGDSGVTYYIAEVDKTGKRISESGDFAYTVSVDNPQLTLTKSADVKTTVTNKDKVSKVTLYLTKRVYDGTSPKKVTETFYAGLFKDPQFTQMYTKPIAMNLESSSTVTLKLSLNLGKASEATIYVAEVDKNGKVVSSGKAFGYDVKMINAAAAFTQERTEIQTVLMNSVYGTSTEDDWNQIISDNENKIGWNENGYGGSGSGYYGNVSDNGDYSGTSGSFGGSADSVQTGDTTPWGWYLTLMLLSGIVITGTAVKRKRHKDE